MSILGSRLLKKMGWREGTGIGKSGSGIVEPIKPKFKVGTAGMGFKESEQLCSGWWMEAFNKAASSTSIAADSGSDKAVQCSRKRHRQQTELPLPVLGRPYSAFESSAFLHEGREVSSACASSSISQPSSTPATSPTDEELLAACGGRTGHVAARFGLSLGGKLARVRAQELGARSATTATTASVAGEAEQERRKRKRRRRRAEEQAEEQSDQS